MLEKILVGHLVNTKYEDLPLDCIQYCKLLIMDSLGVVFPGSIAPGCREIVKLAENWGGDSGSSLLIYGNKTSPPLAALANSTMMHALDFDDTLDVSALHTFVTVLPTALATVEALGEKVSGKQFIAALILGVDIICRLSMGIRRPLSWIRTATCGSFGSAAAAGKILNLNHDDMSNALGIVYSQTAGNAQGLLEGRLVKRMQPGFAASAGVLSAFLAMNGITGSRNFLEGPYGFYRLYEQGEYDVEPVIDKLGEHYTILDLSIKPYPCCRMTHSSIDATLRLRNQISLWKHLKWSHKWWENRLSLEKIRKSMRSLASHIPLPLRFIGAWYFWMILPHPLFAMTRQRSLLIECAWKLILHCLRRISSIQK